MKDKNMIHNCDNATCKLLNPYLEILLTYQELRTRIAKVEETYFNDIRHRDKFAYFPIDFFIWASHHHVWQLFNLEFIQELADKIKEIDPEIILEVGAGRGLLGKYLSKELNREIIITDDYSWWENDDASGETNRQNCPSIRLRDDEIIKMDYKNAIKFYNPDMIIVSWIPYEKEWVKDFREYESVKEYIVIGEQRGGCTGNENDWNTNWNIEDLDSVEKFGICKSDHGFLYRDPVLHTSVTYFERPIITTTKMLSNNSKMLSDHNKNAIKDEKYGH